MTSLVRIRMLLDKSSNPLYFYDDDADGLVSYLLLRREFRKGNGVIIRTRGTHFNEEELYLRKIDEYKPDVVIFLDKPTLNQDIFDKIDVKKIWIDHHNVADVKGVNYYNPRIKNKSDNKPTSYLCYRVAKSKKDLWLATVGSVADWNLVLFDRFKKKYTDLAKEVRHLKMKKKIMADDVLYNTKLGELIRIFSFLLKGKVNEVNGNIEMLMRINEPYEILEKKSEDGRKLFENAEKVSRQYLDMLDKALNESKKSKGRVISFIYVSDKISFTSDLANELIHRNHGKIIAVGRIKDEQVRFSLRSSIDDIDLPVVIEKIFGEMKGTGGGHEHAAAVEIHKDDCEKFIQLLRKHA